MQRNVTDRTGFARLQISEDATSADWKDDDDDDGDDDDDDDDNDDDDDVSNGDDNDFGENLNAPCE